MTIEKRLRTIRLINKIERNQRFSRKIGTLNRSYFEEERNGTFPDAKVRSDIKCMKDTLK